MPGLGLGQSDHRAETVYVDVPPAKQWVVDLRLETPITVPETAPDLAINARDLKWTDNGLQLTVHNIGNADSASTVAVVQVRKGENWATVGRADIPAIPAPRDFGASTEDVLISVRKAEVGNRYRLLVDPEDKQYEVCETNNRATY